MNTIHIEGWNDELDLEEKLSDNYNLDFDFDFDEQSTDTMNNIFLRFYYSDEKTTLEKAIEGHLKKMFGTLEATGEDYGYSEYTVEGFNISSLTLGGHDIGNILKNLDKKRQYVHILIDQLSHSLL